MCIRDSPSLNVPGSISVDLSHVANGVSGSYPVVLTGTDGNGFTASAEAVLTVTVSPAGTEAPTGPTTAPPGASTTASPGAPGASALASGMNPHGSGLAETGAGIGLPVALAALFLLFGALAAAIRLVIIRRRATH